MLSDSDKTGTGKPEGFGSVIGQHEEIHFWSLLITAETMVFVLSSCLFAIPFLLLLLLMCTWDEKRNRFVMNHNKRSNHNHKHTGPPPVPMIIRRTVVIKRKPRLPKKIELDYDEEDAVAHTKVPQKFLPGHEGKQQTFKPHTNKTSMFPVDEPTAEEVTNLPQYEDMLKKNMRDNEHSNKQLALFVMEARASAIDAAKLKAAEVKAKEVKKRDDQNKPPHHKVAS